MRDKELRLPPKGPSPGDEYMTPKWVWEPWHKIFGFTLDAAASNFNKLEPCGRWFTREDDALQQDWRAVAGGGAIWCNPPYSRGGGPLIKWVKKGLAEGRQCGRGRGGDGMKFDNARIVPVVMLLPADTSTDWFSEVWDRIEGTWVPGVRGYFLDGRVRFVDPRTHQRTDGSPNFGSLVLVISPLHPLQTEILRTT